MPKYIVERTFPEGAGVGVGAGGAAASLADVERNLDLGVTWVHSYITEDRRKSFCIYEAPTPEAIRKASAWIALPIDSITQVRVLDPWFYR
jgi:hypothetical protein